MHSMVIALRVWSCEEFSRGLANCGNTFRVLRTLMTELDTHTVVNDPNSGFSLQVILDSIEVFERQTDSVRFADEGKKEHATYGTFVG